VLYSSTSGASWTYAPISSVTLSGANGSTAAQTLEANALPLTTSPSPASIYDQVELVVEDLSGRVTETNYVVLVDTVPPARPTIASLAAPSTYSLLVNGVSATDANSGLASLPYDVQASTDPLFRVLSGDTGWIAGPNTSFTGLLANTSYYVRAQAVDAAGNVSAFATSTAPTLSNTIAAASGGLLSLTASSVTMRWAALPTSPSSFTCEGYELDVSTTNFASGVVYSSVSFSDLASTLAVSGLNVGTTLYFRVATLNWAGVPNYVSLSSVNLQIFPSIAVLMMGLDTRVQMSTVSVSSVVITNVGSIPVTLVVSGSTTSAGSPWVLSVSSAVEAPVLQGEWNATQPASGSFSTAITNTPVSSSAGGNYAGGQSGQAVPSGSSVTMWFKFWAPRSTGAALQQTIQVLYQAVYP
jgi:hypothetical protein